MKKMPGYDEEDCRFVCSLQSEEEECLYKDFFETEKLVDAKREAEAAGRRVNRAAIVFDREAPGIVFKWEPEKKEEKPSPPIRSQVRVKRKK